MLELVFICIGAVAVDGDTLRCQGGAEAGGRVRLARIDAPELPGHCRKGRSCAQGDPFASRDHLASLLTGVVRCLLVDAMPRQKGFQARDVYQRPVAKCRVGQADLGRAQLTSGHAVPWP